MKIIILILILALAGLQYKLWYGSGSIPEWTRLQKKLEKQEQINEKLSERNKIVEADIAELKSGNQALEEQARYELGMIKKGEEYYQFNE
jgi:cell division protein FtsB